MFIYLDFSDLIPYLWQLRVTFKTSLAAQWLRPCVSCKGHKFDLHMPRSIAKKKKKKGVLLPADVEGAPFI